MRTDCRDPRWHLLYVDVLLAKGEMGNVAAEFSVGSLMSLYSVLEIIVSAGWWFHFDKKNHWTVLLVCSNPYSCCYGPSAPGEVKAAGAHLCQVFGQEPRDAVAQARVGVVEAWQQNYRSAACRLSKLTEKDPSSLDFLLGLIPFSQRKRMAQVSLCARILDSVQTEQTGLFWLQLHFLIYYHQQNSYLLQTFLWQD